MKSYMVTGIDGEGYELVSDYDFPTLKEAKIRAKVIAGTPEYLKEGLYAVQIFEELSDKECLWDMVVKKAKLDWHKVPSVWTGGKPYFYNCWIDGRKKYTVVWNMVKKKWMLIEYTDKLEKVLGEFDNEKTAMKKAGELK